jgi:glycerate dehydrogenase
MMKIVFLDESTITLDHDIDFSAFHKLGDYVGYPHSNEQEIIERGTGVRVLITNKARITPRVFESMDSLELVAEIATGFDNVDLEAARAGNVTVCNVAGYAAHTVPQHTFALILNLATKAHLYHADVVAGEWARASSFNLLRYPCFELHGLTIGIIGLGTIGQGVARIAEGFGMNVLAHDIGDMQGAPYPNTELTSLLEESDIVTLHTPLTDETRNLIDAEALSRMKPTALIINTARGGIVDESALAAALNDGRIGGAGFDVLTSEPPLEGNVLLAAPNTIITPHCAWSSREARQNLVDETAANIRAFGEGRPRNVVA